MAYTVQTHESDYPQDGQWVARGVFETPKAAWDFVADQSITAEGEQTTFGLNGRRVVDSDGGEYIGPSDDAVIFGGADPYTVAT